MPAAIYPGSFDPITCGHVDIARRAAAIFERLVVGVYDAPAKALLFPTDERVKLAVIALKDLENVQIAAYGGLTVDFARQIGAKVIIRGLRAVSDFEVEMQMALLNRKMAPDLEVVCLMPSLEYSFLSATMIKEISKLGGSIEGLVPAHVENALREKLRRDDGGPHSVPRYLNS